VVRHSRNVGIDRLREVEAVPFSPGSAEQQPEIAKPFGVSKTEGVLAELDRPDISFTQEHSGRNRRGGTIGRPSPNGRGTSIFDLRRQCHPDAGCDRERLAVQQSGPLDVR
jgi:hypothetical protein